MVLLTAKLDNIDNKSKYLAIILALQHYNLIKNDKDECNKKNSKIKSDIGWLKIHIAV